MSYACNTCGKIHETEEICSEPIKQLVPYRCPICLGSGNVPGGFYLVPAGHIETWSSASSLETCRQCQGKGIIRL